MRYITPIQTEIQEIIRVRRELRVIQQETVPISVQQEEEIRVAQGIQEEREPEQGKAVAILESEEKIW